MATFAIPSLADLTARLRAAFTAEMPGSDAFLWPNNVGPTAKVFAGGLWELFGRLDYVRKQSFALTAEGEWLDQHGAEYNLPRRPPAPASGSAVVTATDAILVPDGSLFLRSDGTSYAAVGDASLSAAGTLTIALAAVSPGSAGLAQAGTALTLGQGPSGPGALGATAIVGSGGITGGLDTEPDGPPFSTDLATYRGRILFRKRNVPMGGAPSDYVLWASSVPGVTRVFVERRYAGPGTVRIYPIFDDLFAGTGGIGDAAAIASVQAVLDAMAPAGAFPVAAAPAAFPIAPTVAGLTPNTSATQEAVAAELRATIRRLGAVAGGDYAVASMPYLATPQSFAAQWIWQSVAQAAGEARARVVLPAADLAIPPGALPVPGPVTFSFP